MPEIFVLRHGRSVANRQGVIASRPTSAGNAFGLTRTGRNQVRQRVALAASSGSLGRPVVVVSSPLLRARESAAVAAEILGVTPSVDARLIERDFGDLELTSDVSYAKVWEADLHDPGHRRWGVESVIDVLRRAGTVVEEWVRAADVATAVLCTHGDVASTLLCAARAEPLEHHRQVGALATGDLEVLPAVDPLLEALHALDATPSG